MKNYWIAFVLVFMLVSPMAMAQGMYREKTSFGILGGVNFQNLNGKDFSGDKLENDLITGFHAGINIQIPVAPEIYFQPGLLFSTKGAKNTEGSMTHTYKLSYVELPLNVVYKAPLGSGYFMLGFGPYVGYAIGGKVLSEGGTVSVESDIEFKNVVELTDPLTTPYFKALDAGGNIFFGYEMASGLFFHGNTQLGMIGINPEYKILSDDKSIIKNTGFGLSVGYRL
jgi:hypothetical protein